jgi:hypothetical protein
MKQIVCMKWGDKYPAEYVDKLYGMVARHITPPFRFVCMTDRPEGIRPEVECLPCPTVPVPPPHNNRGWRKVSLWNDSLQGMEGDWLYLDLDVVVTGTLDGFFEYEPPQLRVRRGQRVLVVGEQFLVELLARPQAGVLDADLVLVRSPRAGSCRARSAIFTGSPMSSTKISPPRPIRPACSTSCVASGIDMK